MSPAWTHDISGKQLRIGVFLQATCYTLLDVNQLEMLCIYTKKMKFLTYKILKDGMSNTDVCKEPPSH